MTITTDAASLDLAQYFRPGDRIVLGQACGECRPASGPRGA